MPSSNQIGNRIEKMAQAILEREGYTVHRAVRAYRPIGPGRLINISTDVFQCVDLIGKKAGERTRWVQVTATGAIGKKIDALRAVPWTEAHDAVEVWLWRGRKLEKGMGREKWKSYQYFDVRSYPLYEPDVLRLSP